MSEVSEVERALERFKLAIDSVEARAMTGETGIVEKVLSRAQNLINALESKPEPKIDMKEECVEPVSIWKDVSELPYYGCRILVKHKHHIQIIPYYYCNGIFTPDNKDFSFEIDNSVIKKFCLLTDFINQVEDMEARLRKLEGK